MGVMITGIAVRRFPSSGGADAVVHVLRGIDEVRHEKFEQEGIGFSTDVPRTKQQLKMDVNYAREIIAKRAFIPNEEYELQFSHNPDDPLEVIITKIIPVHPDVNAKVEAALKNKPVA